MEKTKITETEIISTLSPGASYAHYYHIDNASSAASCKMCLTKFEYNQQKTGTRSLKRHLENKHPKVASARNAIATAAPAQQTLVSSGFVSQPVKKNAASRYPY